ncbi:Tellurium resistance [Frankia sp. CNm7]|uniref:Tellurium resistance n=1 Tax=Frankia nepalensis TaxID=1836974 RepID=A0A937RQ76_9ACTN|nr:Tellurium resistance [Frankia nepalensis]MBL7497958.1 Tellurium resistance [Frankia nepalensis]MBL7512186.1 Tellurium resistance [Frankia nepalensis]MBL7524529.1 Tellurium resistance [Frankia nepalensis]MBL7632980.1 Tellurium resistance [Frankia nepalensis]
MAIDYSKRPSSTPGAAPGAAPGVSLSKVTLTKSAPSVSLSKQGGGGRLHVNLNWNQGGQQKGGFLKRVMGSGGVDLDLAAMWELSTGHKGVVQALGNAFGDFDNPPFIKLDADDRTGATAGGENIHVNLAQAAYIRRILIFAFIYEGVPSWDQADAVVTLTPAQGAPIEVRLDERAGGKRMCAVALLTNNGSNDFTVSREVRYVSGHRELDTLYNWGLNWTPGRK